MVPKAHRAAHVQAEALDPAAAARIWEGQLAGALVAEDGGLALSQLATAAAHGFMPKIQTQGQLGHARWRFVSVPSIPGVPCWAHASIDSARLGVAVHGV